MATPSVSGTAARVGSIVRVKLHNFITYYDVEFCPGPMLNVVLGPNGTGKSTIVCALVLGLGGAPKDIGRAKEISHYVNHEKDEGYIEITLVGTKNDLVVKRQIFKDNKSKWYMNGKLKSQKEVLDRLKKMHVQVSNLCQFLPQERVGEFAKLTPQKLFESTQQAVGSDGLEEKHLRLCSLRELEKGLLLSVGKRRESLARLKEANERLHQDVIRFQQRETLKEQVEKLKMKRPWVEWRVADDTKEAADKERKAAAEELRGHINQAGPELDRKRELEHQIAALTDKQKQQHALIRAEDAKRAKLAEKINKLMIEAEAATSECEQLEEAESQRVRQLEKIDASLAKFQESLVTARQSEAESSSIAADLDAKWEALKAEEDQVRRTEEEMKMQFRELSNRREEANGELRRLANVQEQRLIPIRRDYREAYNAYIWLRENGDKFRDKVYGPLLLHLNVKDQAMASLVETTVSRNVLEAFVCTNDEDAKILYREVIQKQRIQINMITVQKAPLRRERKMDIELLKDRYNALCWADELFAEDTPAPIINVLLEHSNMNTMLVGSDRMTRGDVDQVFQHHAAAIQMIVTPRTVYRFSRSKYGARAVSVLQYDVRPSKYIRSVDTARIEQMRRNVAALDADIAQMRPEEQRIKELSSNLRVRIRENRNEKRGLGNMDKKVRSINEAIARKKRERREYERPRDDTAEIRRLKERAKRCIRDRTKIPGKLLDSFRGINAAIRQVHEVMVEMGELSREKTAVERRLAEYEHRKMTLEQAAQQKEIEYREALDRARALKRAANDACPMSEEVKEMFDKLPETLVEIDAQIETNESRMEAMFNFNPDIIRQYDLRNQQIEQLEAELLNEDDTIARHKANIDELRAQWEPEIEEMVEYINGKFSEYFRAINCEGRVVLEKHEDFAEWGIKPFVGFRGPNSLSVLSTANSGGERSVSTMLYMASLHGLTKCPFRLVDEINQGMDARNERMVFELLSRVTCEKDSPQFFLITPKLLPNLDFGPGMNVLHIMNGPYFVTQDEWVSAMTPVTQRRLASQQS